MSKRYCLMNYTVQCTDVASGATGCFMFDQAHWIAHGEFKATSPVCADLVAFYKWRDANHDCGAGSAYIERDAD